MIFTPNVFSFVDGVQAVLVIRKLDRTRCMSILHHLNGENTVVRDTDNIGKSFVPNSGTCITVLYYQYLCILYYNMLHTIYKCT